MSIQLQAQTQPGLLWIMAENISDELSGSGEPGAPTPHIDQPARGKRPLFASVLHRSGVFHLAQRDVWIKETNDTCRRVKRYHLALLPRT